jgi:polyhydroxybutyrate depolymerase
MFPLGRAGVWILALTFFACNESAPTIEQDAGVGTGADASDSRADADVATCTTHQLPRDLEFEFEGITRSALLAGPLELPVAPLSLILNFHGYTDSPEQQEEFSVMSEHALAEGYVVAYPSGTGLLKSWNAGVCCGNAAMTGKNDVGFAAALIDQIASVACIDTSRVYAVGYSNGGFLSHRLACELSDKIAGIASVAGVMGVPECTPSRSIPVLQFHGTADSTVAHTGNALLGFPSVDETMEDWRVRSGCSDAEPAVVFQEGDATCVEWAGCDQPVRSCSIDGGGHTWPGGTAPLVRGKVSTDLDATAMLWEFFEGAQSP